jgi:single-strand DNA-binding protein
MANYNKVILVGNLTRDPVLRYLPSQMAVADFGLAVNHKYRTKTGEDREEVLFIDCSVFGKGAEVINQYCQKGRPLLVEGRLKYETWEDNREAESAASMPSSSIISNYLAAAMVARVVAVTNPVAKKANSVRSGR